MSAIARDVKIAYTRPRIKRKPPAVIVTPRAPRNDFHVTLDSLRAVIESMNEIKPVEIDQTIYEIDEVDEPPVTEDISFS